MRRFPALLVTTLSLGLAVVACSDDGEDSKKIGDGSGASTGTGATGTGGTGTGTGNVGNNGSGAMPVIGGVPSENGGEASEDFRREKVCDAAGNCTCLNLASLGAESDYGGSGTDSLAFLEWLNTKSSANVTIQPTKPTFSDEWLANYDVLIFQNIEGWTFSSDELAAFERWVRGGGGVMTLTGYSNRQAEVDPVNQLLSFAGMSYNKDDILNDSGCGGRPDCYCWGDPQQTPGMDASHPIFTEVQELPSWYGRSINGGTPIASGASGTYAAVGEFDLGKVFMWNDEWITASSQWRGTQENRCPNMNQYDQCWDEAGGFCKTANNFFQVGQFWFNAIKWVSPPTECDFVIEDEEIDIIIY